MMKLLRIIDIRLLSFEVIIICIFCFSLLKFSLVETLMITICLLSVHIILILFGFYNNYKKLKTFYPSGVFFICQDHSSFFSKKSFWLVVNGHYAYRVFNRGHLIKEEYLSGKLDELLSKDVSYFEINHKNYRICKV